MMRYGGSKCRRLSVFSFLVVFATFTAIGLLMLTLIPVDPSTRVDIPVSIEVRDLNLSFPGFGAGAVNLSEQSRRSSSCASVEVMGEAFEGGAWLESLRVRKLIQNHFHFHGCLSVLHLLYGWKLEWNRGWFFFPLILYLLEHHYLRVLVLRHGASRVRGLPPEDFCRHGFVLAKASEAGFGNEMYKILTAASLSIMFNRSLIVGQTRGKYPFGEYISYSNHTFTLKEVKHLWRSNGCVKKYGRHLIMRTDDFLKPIQTNVLCSNWRKWKQPIIWFQNTTDAVAAQFFLKNIHPEMRNAASKLFGDPELLQSRPNVFGELMRVLISPSRDVEEAVNWVLADKLDPEISLHMRMLMNRPVRAVLAALNCIRKAMQNLRQVPRPRVVLVSDTPSLVKMIKSDISEFAEVLHFDYKHFKGNISRNTNGLHKLDFRVKDWGPAPRWVAFVDFFLASRAKHAVVTGAHKRVGTTYAQLVAALSAAQSLRDDSIGSNFSFLSSFHSNLLTEGLRNQVGWGHVWNRFAGPLSCRNQPNQCAFTPLLPPAWWDSIWQSPISRDIRRLAAFGIQLSGFGTFDENKLKSSCNLRRKTTKTVLIL